MCTVAGTAHRFPASDFMQAEKEDEQTAAQKQYGLKQVRPDYRGQAACDSVCAGDNCQRNDREPEVDAKNGVQGQAACEQNAGQVDEDIGQDGDDAERESAGRSEAVLQPFGHRTDMFSKVEWHEKYDHDGHGREDAPLPVCYGDAVTVRKSNFANELLCRDARSYQRRTDGIPGQSVAGQEVASGGFFLPAGDPESDENDKTDVQDEHRIVKIAQFHKYSLLQTKTLACHVSDDGVSDGLRHFLFLLGCKPRWDCDYDRTLEEVIARWARPLAIFKNAVCVLL